MLIRPLCWLTYGTHVPLGAECFKAFLFSFFFNQKVKGIQTLGIHSIQTWTCFYFATPEVPEIPAKLPSQASATSMPVSTLPPLLSLPAMIMGQA